MDATLDSKPSAKVLINTTLEEGGYKVHPAVDQLALPYARIAELNATRLDIRANGLKVKVLRSCDGTIIDGRMRLAAMLLEGIKPKPSDFETIDSDTNAGIKLRVAQLNVGRRHMTPGQIAMMVAGMFVQGVPIYDEDYKAMGTSEESIARATRVLKSGDQKTIEAVTSGEMSVSHADKVVSGRVPIAATPAIACAAAADEAVCTGVETEVEIETEVEAQPKSRGRQPGNVKVNAVKRGIAELRKAVDYADEVKSRWRPDADEVAEIKDCRSLLNDLLPKTSRKAAAGTEQAAEDSPALH